MRKTFGSLVLFLVLVASQPVAAALPSSLPGGESLPSLAPMLDGVTPAVVNIATYTTVQVRNPLLEDPFFRRFFNVPDRERVRRTQSAGSGVVVDAKGGYIVTNHHVVERADEINVTLADGRTLKATLVGSDPRVDLAVLKVVPDALVEITFADSGALRVGDFVVAIGNPFGLNQTVTSGIISALGRSGLGIEGYEDFIQTDASINPGNSGGALVDLSGRLVGINTAILAPAGGNVGIGFAIPANMVQAIMGELIEHGEVRRGFLGLAVQGLNPDLAEAFGVENREGVVVVEVQDDGAAAKAGLRPGDIITRVGDRPIRRVTEFDGQAALMFVGERVPVEILRDGRVRRVTFDIRDEPLEKIQGERLDRRLLGTTLQNFRNDSGLSDDAGVLVSDVTDGSMAWEFGLRPGDIVVACNRRGVRNLEQLQAAVEGAGDQLLLRVYRSGQYGYIVIR
ncbi:MAG: Do family serine endopeptidase [Pseudomonadales bacterium]